MVVAALIAALLVELRDASHPSTAPPTGPAREHRDADTAAALVGPRQRADLAPCPRPGGQPGPGVTTECAADGSVVDVGPALAGHRVVLNLWAYWCAPCATELPAMAEYQRRVGSDVMVVTVHQDENEAAALSRLAELGVRLPTLQDGSRRVAAALRVRSSSAARSASVNFGKVRRAVNAWLRIFIESTPVMTTDVGSESA